MIDKLQEILSKDYTINIIGLPLSTTLASLQDQDNTFDSLTRVAFLVEVEDTFNIELPKHTYTIQDIVNSVGKI